jgi:hypothetical protein
MSEEEPTSGIPQEVHTDKQPKSGIPGGWRDNEIRNRQLEGIGRFLFEFSQLQFTIRHVLAIRLELEDEYFDIITGPYDFAMLCKVTEQVVLLKTKDYAHKHDRIKNYFQLARNSMIQGC